MFSSSFLHAMCENKKRFTWMKRTKEEMIDIFVMFEGDQCPPPPPPEKGLK